MLHPGLHRAFLVTTAIVVVGAAVTGLTYSFWAIAYFRFLTGVGVGGITAPPKPVDFTCFSSSPSTMLPPPKSHEHPCPMNKECPDRLVCHLLYHRKYPYNPSVRTVGVHRTWGGGS